MHVLDRQAGHPLQHVDLRGTLALLPEDVVAGELAGGAGVDHVDARLAETAGLVRQVDVGWGAVHLQDPLEGAALHDAAGPLAVGGAQVMLE